MNIILFETWSGYDATVKKVMRIHSMNIKIIPIFRFPHLTHM